MKKIIIALLLVFALMFTSCDRNDIRDNTSDHEVDFSGIEYDDETSADDILENLTPYLRCYYGEDTGTDKTYTGFEPLPLHDFILEDLENSEGKSQQTISHSFGVAKDGRPNDISVNNQKFFDENGYDAVCVNNTDNEKILYLTFDCGYENGYTGKILDTLKEKNVKAAFFCTLLQVKANPEIIARMIQEGHIVGNHSVHHPDFSKLSRQEMIDEVKGFDDYMREHFGYSSFYFRYPQGKYSEDSLDVLNSLGYKCVFWSLAYEDWDMNKQKGPDFALDTVISRLHPGSVMLLHAVSPDNAAALGKIIDTAESMGYKFDSLEEIK